MDLLAIQTRIKAQARLNTTELDSLLLDDINAAYLQLSRKGSWNQLRVDGATLTTVAGQVLYALPAPFDRFVENSLRYSYQATVQQGWIIPIVTQDMAQLYRDSCANATRPRVGSVTGGGTVFLNTGTVTAANQNQQVHYSSTANPAWVGLWIAFHSDPQSNNGQGYPYLIQSIGSGTLFILSEPYRGPNLTTASFEITPANTRQILLDPPFNDSGGVPLVYSYYRKPRRLYNPQDVPEVEDLCEAIIWQVLVSNAAYHNDQNLPIFQQNYRTAMKDAFVNQR